MPKNAAIHIQKIAPGPPTLTAVATPTMLPVPIVAASATQSALKLEMSPAPLFFARRISPSARGSCTTCSSESRIVSRMPVPTSSVMSGMPQRNESIAFSIGRNDSMSHTSKNENMVVFYHDKVLNVHVYMKCLGSTDKFSRAILTHLFCPNFVGKSST